MIRKASLVVTGIAIHACAGTAGADGGRILDAIGMTGSPSLALSALSDPRLPLPLKQVHAKISHDMGLTGQPDEITYSRARFAPVLTYDGNINGGSVGDSITISGLTFDVDDRFRAKSGLLVGGSFSGGLRIHAGPATAIEMDFAGMLGWAPKHDIAKTKLNGAMCVRHMVGTATHLRGCVDAYQSTYELGKTRRAGVEVSVSHAFATKAAFHEISLGVKRNRYFEAEIYEQNVLSVQYVTARPGPLALNMSVQLGSATGNHISMHERVSLGLATEITGKKTALNLSAQNNLGGLFLGEKRAEHVYGVAISREVSKKLTVTAVYTKIKAKHEFFNDQSLGFDIGLRF